MVKNRLYIVISLALVIGLVLTQCSPPGSEQGSMFRGNSLHTGYYSSGGPGDFHQAKWKFQTKDAIRSSPVIVDHIVYFGSDDHHVYAVDAETGEMKWAFQTGGAVKSSAAIANGVLFIYSGDGKLYALDRADGKLKWSYQTEGTDAPRDKLDYWQSSPAVSEGIVYFGAGEGMFYAVNASSGEPEWKQKMEFNGYNPVDPITPVLHSSPAVNGGVVYVGIAGLDPEMQAEPGNVAALDAKTGERLWISPLLMSVDSSPVLDDEAVYVGMRNGGIAALDRTTGSSLWTQTSVPYLLGSFALHEGTLYSGSSDTHQLLALDAKTGDTKWTYDAVGPIHASPATDGTTVFFACGNHYTEDNQGIVYAVDAGSGKEKWQYKTGGNIYSSPALDEGVLFVGSDDGYLHAIE